MYTYSVNVQFEDIDSYGIIHHPRILYFMERARVHFLLDNNIQVKDSEHGLVLREITIQLKSQITMFDKVDIELTTTNIDKYRFTFVYHLKVNNKLMVIAQTQMVVIDLESKKLVTIPENILPILKLIEQEI